MIRRAPALARLVAASAVAVLALAACTPDKTQVSPDDAAPTSTGTPAPGGTGASGIYEQQLEWSECGELECATIRVPLDWSDEDGDTIEVALNRHRALDADARLGSLLINPGGPGGSGLALTEPFVTTAGEALLDSYDVIGFDPRGVAASTPVQCGTDEQVDEYYIPDRLIETQDDLDEANEAAADFAALCRLESGAVVENVDTVSAARDMDVIRAAVGDEQLNFLGFSYGTQLGATYAELYPENVGRLVLDGAVDFLLPSVEQASGQAEGFENALTNFLRWCGERDSCPLAGGVDAMKSQLSSMMDRALDDPFPSGTEWGVNGNLFVYGVVVTLYDEASWPFLEQALAEVAASGDASIMYELANFYLDRDGTTGEYTTNSTWAFTAIGCLDDVPGDEWTIEDVDDFRAEMREASPTFGWWFASGAGCDAWPWTADRHITSLESAATAEQMLVIGTTNDPATPYWWSESLAERLDATLLTYDGEGHTAYGRSNQCIIDQVDGFLVDGEMPDSGTQC
ncbi:alpha/beta hydrolase [Demequina sp. SO4-13]|uniref:alpha/beta hydrolase n=1 Tax=Demequina sp. SO4-13 TaxID=3401027 RepID=UPI003AF99187